MDLFGLNRFVGGPDRDMPPQRGVARWFQVLWDNLGGLLGGNALTFAGFLPLALGVSLGIVLENLWLTLLGGALGGALAGMVWTPMLSLSLQAFQGGTGGWLGRWRRAVGSAPLPSALAGGAAGLLAGGLMLIGGFAGQALAQGDGSPLLVWAALAADLFLLSLAVTLFFPALCVKGPGRPLAARELLSLFFAAPGRICAAAAGSLLWAALAAAIFPVSVPLALAIGFWPPALLTAQLLLPALESVFSLPQWAGEGLGGVSPEKGLSPGQRGEIWWRRRWPLVVGGVLLISLALGAANTLLSRREPDLQIAVVHAQSLPDGVRAALERSLAQVVGDCNGDGHALVQVNDYAVVFDGSATDMDVQTAGSTLLLTDAAGGYSALFLVEDSQGFLQRYADKVDETYTALWGDYPLLSDLDAGTYSPLEDIQSDLPGQDLLAPLRLLPARSADPQLLEALLR